MEQQKGIPAEIEAALDAMVAGEPATAAVALAEVTRRAAAALNGLAGREKRKHKGEADWAKWARLANATRALVLEATSCRDAARQLRQG